MKIIAVLLLIIGVGVCFTAFFNLSLHSKSQERCLRYSSRALEKANEAVAAKGTANEAVLTEAARAEHELAQEECSNANELKVTAVLFIIGALSSTILAIFMLAWSVKRGTRAKNMVVDKT